MGFFIVQNKNGFITLFFNASNPPTHVATVEFKAPDKKMIFGEPFSAGDISFDYISSTFPRELTLIITVKAPHVNFKAKIHQSAAIAIFEEMGRANKVCSVAQDMIDIAPPIFITSGGFYIIDYNYGNLNGELNPQPPYMFSIRAEFDRQSNHVKVFNRKDGEDIYVQANDCYAAILFEKK